MIHPMHAGRYSLTLSTKREIDLAILHQEPSYLYWLVGNPTRSINRDLVQSHLRMAQEHHCRPSLPLKPALLEPTFKPISSRFRGGCVEEDTMNPYELLPPILSVAVFDSSSVGAVEACSSALVLWYQHEWGLPTLPVQDALEELDWEVYAYDWTW